jgi:hypothetical protein
MECPQCQTENREGATICEECGAKMELECPKCRAKISLGKKSCGECEHDLRTSSEAHALDYDKPKSYTTKFLADKILSSRTSTEGEHKIVTVMFADVAGFTAMSGKLHAEEVHEITDGCFIT